MPGGVVLRLKVKGDWVHEYRVYMDIHDESFDCIPSWKRRGGIVRRFGFCREIRRDSSSAVPVSLGRCVISVFRRGDARANVGTLLWLIILTSGEEVFVNAGFPVVGERGVGADGGDGGA